MTATKPQWWASLLLLFAILICCQQPSSAQQPPGYFAPSFSARQHVYVDPAIANDRLHPMNLSGLESALEKAGQKNRVTYVVVFAQAPPKATPTIATNMLNEQVSRWASQADFSKLASRIFVIEVVRRHEDAGSFVVSGNAGAELKKYGFDGAGLSQKTGPLLSVDRRAYLPNNPVGYVSAVVTNLNTTIDKYESSQRFWSRDIYFVLAGFGLCLYLAFCFWCRSRLRAVITDALEGEQDSSGVRHGGFKNISANLLEMQQNISYLESISGNSHSGESATQYYIARDQAAEFYKHFAVYNQMLESAQAACNLVNFFYFPASMKACADLTDNVMKITGDELPIHLRPADGSKVKEEHLSAKDVLARIKTSFPLATKACKTLQDALDSAAKNNSDIDNLMKQIEQSKFTELEKEGLKPASFEKKLQQLRYKVPEYLALFGADPIQAARLSSTLLSSLQQLCQDIDQAIALKESVTEVMKQLDAAQKLVNNAKKESVPHLPQGDPSTLLFVEEGYSEYPLLRNANDNVTQLLLQLQEGEFKKAEKAKTAALESCAAITELVNSTLKLKDNLPQLAIAADHDMSNLLMLAASVRKSLSQFTGLPLEAIEAALQSAENHPPKHTNSMGSFYNEYNQQHFRMAQPRVQSILSTIRVLADHIRDCHRHLNELHAARQQVRQQLPLLSDSCQQVRKLLATDPHPFVVPTATKDTLERCTRDLTSCQRQAEETAPAWVSLQGKCETLAKQLQSVRQEASDAVSAHHSAVSNLQLLGSKIDSARLKLNHDDVGSRAKSDLADAEATQRSVGRKITQAGSDWKQLDKQLKRGLEAVASAVQMAERDIRQANDERQAKASQLRSEANYARTSYSSSQQQQVDAYERDYAAYQRQNDLINMIVTLEAIRAIQEAARPVEHHHYYESSRSSDYGWSSPSSSSPSSYDNSPSQSSGWGGGYSSGDSSSDSSWSSSDSSSSGGGWGSSGDSGSYSGGDSGGGYSGGDSGGSSDWS